MSKNKDLTDEMMEGNDNGEGEGEGEENGPKYEYLDDAMKEQVEDVFEYFDKQGTSFIEPKFLAPALQALNFNPTESEL